MAIAPKGHIVHMTLDHSDPQQSYSVATCDCSWNHRVRWPGHHNEQDAVIEAHWQQIKDEAGAKVARPTLKVGRR